MEQQPRQTEEVQAEAVITPETELRDEAEQQETNHEQELVPRIYVASLSDYNDGRLHGVWVDAAQEPEALHDVVQDMLRSSPTSGAEEWAIHDFEGFNGLHLGEWENLEHVSRVAKGIRENGVAFAHWATLVSSDEDLDRFSDAYLGRWESLETYAQDIFESSGVEHTLENGIPEALQPYVRLDAAAFGRDLVLGGEIMAVEGDDEVHLFSGRW